jgi:hypothetical protein
MGAEITDSQQFLLDMGAAVGWSMGALEAVLDARKAGTEP